MDITYRYSTVGDADAINGLIERHFGLRKECGALEALDGRYLLAFDGDRLVALTGISGDTQFDGLEVDWTCCDEAYRHHGLITDMLRRCLKGADRDVYCSCWHEQGHEHVNLHHAMSELGFELLLKQCRAYKAPYYKACIACARYHDGIACECTEDLYVKRI